MRTALLVTTPLAWLALSSVASAGVTLNVGPLDPTYFAGQTVGANTFSVAGDQWSLVAGQAGIQKGTTPFFAAAPLGMGTSTTTGTPYMSVEGGGTEMVTFGSARTSIAIYWGSIDGNVNANNNSLAVKFDGYALTGAELAGMGADGGGNQTDPAGNQLVTITGLASFTEATFSSTGNAFEFSLVTPVIALTAGAPEPSTWAMMAIGFAALGYAAFRRNTKGRALAI
jgi:hypothetical protein